MKNLLRLIVVILFFQSAQAIGVLRVSPDFLRSLEEIVETSAEQEKTLRERYAEINLAGGVVKGKPGRLSVGCKTPGDFIEYTAFILYGKGSLPSSHRCWPLKDGTEVEIKPIWATTDNGIQISLGCTEKFDICLFNPGWFGKNFYTHINLIEPIK
jgi:hypothetical protein